MPSNPQRVMNLETSSLQVRTVVGMVLRRWRIWALILDMIVLSSGMIGSGGASNKLMSVVEGVLIVQSNALKA